MARRPQDLSFLALAGVLAVITSSGCAADDAEAPSLTTHTADTTSVCPTGFLGDRAAEAVVELRALRSDGADVAIVDGGDLALVTPPQGGRVAFVGVRATNLDGCGVQIFAALRDPLSKETRLDGRTVNLQRDTDGFGTSGAVYTNIADYRELGSFAHIPLCPNQWAQQDLFDGSFELDVRVVDRGGRTATRVVRVVPRCSEAKCQCICKKGYVLGTSCP
jgi:hypothetical protein